MVFGLGWGGGLAARGAGGPGDRVGQLARGGAGVAASVLGLRVARVTTLRVSALFALRSLVSPLALPLDSGVLALAWGGLLAAAQTAALAAALRDWAPLPGLLGRAADRVFTPPDAPFVAVYGYVVLFVGPLAALVETVVVVYEIVRLTRRLEERMDVPDESTSKFWQRITILIAALLYAAACALMLALPLEEVRIPALVASAAALLISLFAPAGNIIHAAGLALYVCILCALALSEELDLRASFRPSLHLAEPRACGLVLTAAAALASLARLPWLIGVVANGADAMNNDPTLAAGPSPYLKGVVNAAAVVSLTFRFLVYHRDVLPGEYYPVVCRGIQILALLMFYLCVMKIESDEDVPLPSTKSGDLSSASRPIWTINDSLSVDN